LAVSHTQICLKTINFRVANICPIEKGWKQSVQSSIVHLQKAKSQIR
jgi:hypothetical protein